jgi:Fe-S cluster assembly iron-binding protein IscA
LTLDESRKGDTTIEAKGIPFYFDPFSLQYLEDLTIDYNAELHEFLVSSPGGMSGC